MLAMKSKKKPIHLNEMKMPTKTMNSFDKWVEENYKAISSRFNCSSMKEAYKAGMLQAAGIVKKLEGRDYDTIVDEIKEEADSIK